MNGLLILNKPAGITSRKAVDRAEQWFPDTRIGHAGTLDPAATGVLVLCLGEATRLMEYVQRMSKTYVTTIRLGARSDTDDAEGTIQTVENPRVPTEQQVKECLAGFIGEQEQVPPTHSAAHVQGRRAHRLARAGRDVQLTARRIRIDAIQLMDYVFPRLNLIVECGKGTYIRSLARDVGERLGCGGLVESLQRTRIGSFHLSEALDLDATAETVRRQLLPMTAAVAELPSIFLQHSELRRLLQGQTVAVGEALQPRVIDEESEAGEPRLPDERDVAVFDASGALAAIARWHAQQGLLLPHKVFHPPKVLDLPRPEK